MGRKKKYATPEEAKEAQNRRRRRTFMFSNRFDEIKASVEDSPRLLEKILERSKDTYDWNEFDESDVYLYAIIGVDTTIDALYKSVALTNNGGESKLSKTRGGHFFGGYGDRLVLLANQLRFRSWLYDKLELSAKLSKDPTEDETPTSRVPGVIDLRNKHMRHRRTKAELEEARRLEAEQKEKDLEDAEQTRFDIDQINQTKEEPNNVDSITSVESNTEQEGTI